MSQSVVRNATALNGFAKVLVWSVKILTGQDLDPDGSKDWILTRSGSILTGEVSMEAGRRAILTDS